ncbi:MAG: hypothetical protein M0Q53_14810 [Prolixibacteraceae bacterium]|nr:hypothetical protein [Prolixibacteraceae bacterium]
MKSKIKIVCVFLIFAALISISFLSIDRNGSNDLNLNALIKIALADGEGGGGGGGGTLTCKCKSCPGDESGCWSYNYDDTSCGGNNSGYTGSTQCQGYGAGYIEEHVITCNGPC